MKKDPIIATYFDSKLTATVELRLVKQAGTQVELCVSLEVKDSHYTLESSHFHVLGSIEDMSNIPVDNIQEIIRETYILQELKIKQNAIKLDNEYVH